jgi:hypothetical protein
MFYCFEGFDMLPMTKAYGSINILNDIGHPRRVQNTINNFEAQSQALEYQHYSNQFVYTIINCA